MSVTAIENAHFRNELWMAVYRDLSEVEKVQIENAVFEMRAERGEHTRETYERNGFGDRYRDPKTLCAYLTLLKQVAMDEIESAAQPLRQRT